MKNKNNYRQQKTCENCKHSESNEDYYGELLICTLNLEPEIQESQELIEHRKVYQEYKDRREWMNNQEWLIKWNALYSEHTRKIIEWQDSNLVRPSFICDDYSEY